MKVCPVDFMPCCDDVCHGGGCIRSRGEEMIDLCHTCHRPIACESFYDCCECEDGDFDDDDDFE